jgi:hypothetical protein
MTANGETRGIVLQVREFAEGELVSEATGEVSARRIEFQDPDRGLKVDVGPIRQVATWIPDDNYQVTGKLRTPYSSHPRGMVAVKDRYTRGRKREKSTADDIARKVGFHVKQEPVDGDLSQGEVRLKVRENPQTSEGEGRVEVADNQGKVVVNDPAKYHKREYGALDEGVWVVLNPKDEWASAERYRRGEDARGRGLKWAASVDLKKDPMVVLESMTGPEFNEVKMRPGWAFLGHHGGGIPWPHLISIMENSQSLESKKGENELYIGFDHLEPSEDGLENCLSAESFDFASSPEGLTLEREFIESGCGEEYFEAMPMEMRLTPGVVIMEREKDFLGAPLLQEQVKVVAHGEPPRLMVVVSRTQTQYCWERSDEGELTTLEKIVDTFVTNGTSEGTKWYERRIVGKASNAYQAGREARTTHRETVVSGFGALDFFEGEDYDFELRNNKRVALQYENLSRDEIILDGRDLVVRSMLYVGNKATRRMVYTGDECFINSRNLENGRQIKVEVGVGKISS